MTNKERVRRLRRWAEIVRTRKRGVRFNMRHWHEKTPCGTVVCALGDAALDGEFRRLGLGIINDDVVYFLGERWENAASCVTPWIGRHAAAGFFGLTDEEAANIVMPANYKSRRPTRAVVAARIDALADKYERRAK